MSRPLIRQAELLKAVGEWLRLGYSVTVTADGVEVTPKAKPAKTDEFASVSMK